MPAAFSGSLTVAKDHKRADNEYADALNKKGKRHQHMNGTVGCNDIDSMGHVSLPGSPQP
eukprot:scaffold404897_cov28-Prasinocladus_malaysianus.AAC.1